MARTKDLNKMAEDYAEEYSKKSSLEKNGGGIHNLPPATDPADFKANIEKIADECLTKTACTSCPYENVCNRLDWSKDHTFLEVTGCSQHPDQKKFKGKSTTVVITNAGGPSGTVARGEGAWNWASIRGNTGTNVWDKSFIQHGYYRIGGGNYIYRGFLYYDTTSIPGGATVLSAFERLYATILTLSNGETGNTQYAGAAVPHNPLVNGDYDLANWAAPIYNTFDHSTLVLAAYNDIPLTNLAWIAPGAITRGGLRLGADIANVDPSAPGDNKGDRFDASAGANPPRLSVTYDVPPPGAGGPKGGPGCKTWAWNNYMMGD